MEATREKAKEFIDNSEANGKEYDWTSKTLDGTLELMTDFANQPSIVVEEEVLEDIIINEWTDEDGDVRVDFIKRNLIKHISKLLQPKKIVVVEELKAEIERLKDQLLDGQALQGEMELGVDMLKEQLKGLDADIICFKHDREVYKERLKAKGEVIEKMKEPVKYAIDSVENDVKESRLPESYTKDVNEWKQLLSGLTKEID